MVVQSQADIDGLVEANAATARLLRDLVARAHPGTKTKDLDRYALQFIQRIQGEPVFHTQNGFPGAINPSINDEAVHGVPGERVLRSGDLLKIDCGIYLNGYCGDTTTTIIVGEPAVISPRYREVLDAAREALRLGIAAVRVGGKVGDIGQAMQSFVEAQGLRLLPGFTGHGLGRRLWEPPTIPAVGRRGTGPRIADGLVFTIEPIVTSDSGEVYQAADGWTIRTVDRAPVAQFEHTVIATWSGTRVLTA